MTLLKDNNYKNINIALLSLENDIKKLSNFDTSAIDKQLVEINERIDEINAGSDSSSSNSGDNSAEINDLRAEIEDIEAQVSNNSTKINDIRTSIEDITKTYTIPDVTTATVRYIKLGTFPWWFDEAVKVRLDGNCFADTVEFNVLGGDGSGASVNGWYTTNSGKTTGIYVVPVAPVSWTSNIEVWLSVEQLTTLAVKLIGSANAAQYFNTNPQMNNTQTYPTGAKLAAYFNMERGYFGYNENTLNCYDTTMTDIGFTQNQVVSVSEFAQALINYTGIHRGQVHFNWHDAGRAYIKSTTPYNTQLEINGGTVIFHSRSHNVSQVWNTFEAEYINRAGELFTFGIITDGNNNIVEYVRKEVDTSGKVATAGTADAAKGWKEYTLNLKGLSNSNFYPVVIDTMLNFVDIEIRSEDGGGYLPYNQNRIKFTISAAGWTDTPKSLFISEYNRYDANEVTIGCIGYCNEDALKAVIWLRGGLLYTCYTMNCPSAPAVKTVDTALDTSIVTVGTSYSGGTNTKVSILFTPDSTMSSGIYSSAGMTTAGNLAIKNNTGGTYLDGYGKEPLSIGVASNLNVGLDHNSIQARNNGNASQLLLNYYGGLVRVNGEGNANGGLQVSGRLNIPTSAPSNPSKGDIWLVL